MEHLRAAELRDPTREKFRIAEESMFHWAAVMNPKHPRALLNYCLLLQCVLKDYDLAEKFYRRALAAGPEDPLVVKNYQDFQVGDMLVQTLFFVVMSRIASGQPFMMEMKKTGVI